MKPRTCPICETELGQNPRQRYCSKRCKNIAYRARRQQQTPGNTCIACGTIFFASNPRKMTCSEPCRKAWNKARDKAYHRRRRNNALPQRRQRYRKQLVKAEKTGTLRELRRKQREERETALANRDNNNEKRNRHLERERTRNLLRAQYLKNHKQKRALADILTAGAEIIKRSKDK